MGILTRAQAHRDGISDAQLQRAVKRGELYRIAAGIYMRADHYRELDARARHRYTTLATVAACGPGAIVSHASAAVMHGLDCGALGLNIVHVTRNRSSGGRKSVTFHLHAAPLVSEEIVRVDGVATTSLARTLVDIARTTSFEDAVVIGDCALRRGMRREDVASVLERLHGRRGMSRARVVAEFIESGAESPGESISRVRMRADGWPTPTLQQEIRFGGRFIGRVDFFWKEHGVVGEFDGMVKYRSENPGAVLEREKLREDAIRDAGFEVFRWVWADLRDFERVRERFDRACLRRAAR
ncbi:type IV toxin-antitoxin system AbiEi family antitoxin domain-containing protein [Rhodococcus sp. 24CO]|uniref:type IV toxin-antitoxin system AbiEi family antitoxin domain-containing protein n=1 Tax=Rhodococcus sp. 24CO TaxID=3117460 RepID=UPI003D346C76